MATHRKSLVVIGGGAAGFFCAVNAARLAPGLDVVVLEKSTKLLSKVRVSGGGRCNVTHACFDITEMASRYPRGKNFVKRAFPGFFTTDTVNWFRERGVELKTEKDGRMFPITDSSETIIQCLLREADRYGVKVRLNCAVTGLLWSGTSWRVSLEGGQELDANFLCIASGGYPKKEQYHWLSTLGHRLVPPIPSLFTFNAPGHPITKLMGVAVEHAVVRIPSLKAREEGPLLITHWGISGPAVIRLSAWLARELEETGYKADVFISWLPTLNEAGLKERMLGARQTSGSNKVRARSLFGLPQRLWEFLLDESAIAQQNWAELTSKQQNALLNNLLSFRISISGKTTFKEEFVTAGGIHLSEVDPATMKSKLQEGLYFAGEVLDVDGITGGYNFQHAWTSGYNAARDIAGKSIS